MSDRDTSTPKPDGGGIQPDTWYSHWEVGRRLHLGTNVTHEMRQQLEAMADEMEDEPIRPVKRGNAVITTGRLAIEALIRGKPG